MKKFHCFVCFFFGLLTTVFALVPVDQGCFEREKSFALLKTAENLLKEAKTSFPSCNNQSDCGKQKSLAYIDISKNLISEARQIYPICNKPVIEDEKPIDCSELFENGSNKSGIYTIWPRVPFTIRKPLQVYCDMVTDKGGWTVIQRRGKFSVHQDFYQDWETYRIGFGNISEEFWLGNENIRILCLKGCEIRFDLQDALYKKGFANYQSFNLTGSKYRIGISGYSGDAGDGMAQHNNLDFATKDQDWIGSTDSLLKGGWWYRKNPDFYNTDLNGIYRPGVQAEGLIMWYGWKGSGFQAAEIKVRPKKV